MVRDPQPLREWVQGMRPGTVLGMRPGGILTVLPTVLFYQPPQGITILVGIVSYAVVHFRRRRIELLVARRIQQQINA